MLFKITFNKMNKLKYNMNSTTIATTKKFTISLTKAELDLIQKQFLEEMDEMLDKIRKGLVIAD